MDDLTEWETRKRGNKTVFTFHLKAQLWPRELRPQILHAVS